MAERCFWVVGTAARFVAALAVGHSPLRLTIACQLRDHRDAECSADIVRRGSGSTILLASGRFPAIALSGASGELGIFSARSGCMCGRRARMASTNGTIRPVPCGHPWTNSGTFIGRNFRRGAGMCCRFTYRGAAARTVDAVQLGARMRSFFEGALHGQCAQIPYASFRGIHRRRTHGCSDWDLGRPDRCRRRRDCTRHSR